MNPKAGDVVIHTGGTRPYLTIVDGIDKRNGAIYGLTILYLGSARYELDDEIRFSPGPGNFKNFRLMTRYDLVHVFDLLFTGKEPPQN